MSQERHVLVILVVVEVSVDQESLSEAIDFIESTQTKLAIFVTFVDVTFVVRL